LIVIEKIREHALATPDKAALVFNNEAIDYPAFYRRIMAVREYLLGFGLKPGSVGVAWVASIADGWVINLAMRSLGLVTLAAQSLDELGQFDRVDVSCLVLSAREAPPLLAMGSPRSAPVIRVPLDLLDTAGEGDLPAAPAESLDGGHILLTSGTTGLYKKIWLDPARLAPAVERGLQQARDGQAVGAGPGKRVVNLSNFGLWTYTGYGSPPTMWMTGSTIVAYQGPQPWRALEWPTITSTWVTPASLRAILAAPEGALSPRPQMLLYAVGGAIAPALAHAARERITPRLTNVLGATEAGVWATTAIECDDDLRLHKLTTARTVEVVDPAGAVLPAGQLGELRVKLTDGAQGRYYDDPEASGQFFRDGWFYPGDLAVLHADGRLSLHGRSTDVLAIQGDKYPAEPFERGLRERLDVEDACVFAMTSSQGDQLHVVLQTSKALAKEAVDSASAAVLYGFPKAFIHVVADMPRNHMGKVQRLKLKQMLMARPASH
jgi:acyl-coenzyme A synthetase/AMP-(fatty) acid ligase